MAGNLEHEIDALDPTRTSYGSVTMFRTNAKTAEDQCTGGSPSAIFECAPRNLVFASAFFRGVYQPPPLAVSRFDRLR
jgi:hypothetical protein